MLLNAVYPFLALASLVSCAPLPQDEAAQADDFAAQSASSQPESADLAAASSSGRWSALANITSGGKQFPRQEHSVAAVGTDVYAIGGILPFDGTTYPTVAKVQKYSTTSDKWSDVADMPAALNHANVATVNGKIYVLGGLAVTADGGPAYWGPSAACSVYDPATNKWTVLPNMPEPRAVGAAAVMVQGTTIYLAGGLKFTNLATGDEGSITLMTSYDTKSKKWTSLTDMPAARDHAGKGVVGNTLYVFGGRDHGHYNVKADSYAYSPKTNQWSTVASMPIARGGVASATIGNRIYLSGGEGNVGAPNEIFPQMQAYDASKNKWIKLADMARPVHGTDAAAVNGKVYVPGGGSAIGGAPTAWTSVFSP